MRKSAAVQTTTTNRRPVTTTHKLAPALGAGDLEQRLAFCLTAAVVAGRCQQSVADQALSRWLMRPAEASGLLDQFAHVSAAHRGLVLIRWRPS
jgi:hypothetical protein